MPGKNYATTHIIILITTVYFRSPGGERNRKIKRRKNENACLTRGICLQKKRENVETSRREDSSKHHILQRERERKKKKD